MEWRLKAAKDGGRKGREGGWERGREEKGRDGHGTTGKRREGVGEGEDGKGKARDVHGRESLHLRLTLTHIPSCPSPPSSTLSLPS